MPEIVEVQHRLFVALAAPDTVKAEITKSQDELRGALRAARISWTRPEQFHLTLKFLGNVPAQRVGDLTEALRAACTGFGSLQLRAERVGCFPDLRRPRVIWAGVRDQAEQLPRLQRAAETACRGFTAEEREERFTGHITLGRIKDMGRSEAERLAGLVRGMAEKFFGEWQAATIELMRSELSPQGARYTVLAPIPLTPPSIQ